MTAPNLQDQGSISASTSAAPAQSFGTHQADDILIMSAVYWGPNTSGTPADIPLPTTSGLTWAVLGSQQAIGTDGKIATFWTRATGAGHAVSLSQGAGWDTGADTVYAARSYVIRGCETSGDPFDAVAQSAVHTAANGALAAVTVSGSERMVLHFFNHSDNSNTAAHPAASGWTVGTRAASGTGTDAEFNTLRQDNIASSTAADATDAATPAQGGYSFTGVSFKPPGGGGTTFERAAALDGVGAIAAAGTFWSVFSRSVAIAATGALTVANRVVVALRSAAIAATGAIATNRVVVALRSAAVSAVAAIESAGSVLVPAIERAASLAATGAITVSNRIVVLIRSAALAVTGAISASAIRVLLRSAAVAATGAITSAGARTLVRAAALAATGAVTVAGAVTHVFQRAAALAATGAVTVSNTLKILLRQTSVAATAAVNAAGEIFTLLMTELPKIRKSWRRNR
jgi:hypothetical protein